MIFGSPYLKDVQFWQPNNQMVHPLPKSTNCHFWKGTNKHHFSKTFQIPDTPQSATRVHVMQRDMLTRSREVKKARARRRAQKQSRPPRFAAWCSYDAKHPVYKSHSCKQAWVLQYDSNGLMAWTDRKKLRAKNNLSSIMSCSNVLSKCVRNISRPWGWCGCQLISLPWFCRAAVPLQVHTHAHARKHTHTHTLPTSCQVLLTFQSMVLLIKHLTCKISQYIFNSKHHWYWFVSQAWLFHTVKSSLS